MIFVTMTEEEFQALIERLDALQARMDRTDEMLARSFRNVSCDVERLMEVLKNHAMAIRSLNDAAEQLAAWINHQEAVAAIESEQALNYKQAKMARVPYAGFRRKKRVLPA
jgi:transcription initiation factor IIE alpha subunit